jgi:hypothetical protein
MRLFVAAFLEDQALGERWEPPMLPMHLGLVDVVDVEASLAEVEAVVEVVLASYGPLYAEGGDDAAVGFPGPDLALQLDDDGTIAEVHRDLLRGLRPLLADPGAAASAWRPEIVIRDDDRPERGDELEFDAVAIVVLTDGAWELAAQFPLI